MLLFHAGVSSCTTSSLSWCCTATCSHGLWPNQGSCRSAAEPQWCSNSANLPAVTSAYCETRMFSSGVKEPKICMSSDAIRDVLLCLSYADLACVMTVYCRLLWTWSMLLFRLWWLWLGLSFSWIIGFKNVSSRVHWFAELGGMPGPLRVRCSMHSNKAALCIAGFSFALQLSVPVCRASAQRFYTHNSVQSVL